MSRSKPKIRLDVLLVERGLVESRALAQRMILAGQVQVDGSPTLKPGTRVSPESQVSLEQRPRYVSRGGEKLEAALQTFNLEVISKICADVGASTGGFTDCLLQHGAARVYAIDVGQGILAWKLRQNPAVVVLEGTNARYVEKLPEPIDVVTIDASFISLRIFFPVVKHWFSPIEGNLLALIKPQFEAGKREADRTKGVIRNPEIHRRVLKEILTSAQVEGFHVRGLIRSPLLGPKGNVEFLAWLSLPQGKTLKLDELINPTLEKLKIL